MTTSQWKLLAPYSKCDTFEKEGIDPSIAQILINRGMTRLEEMQVFLHANYDTLGDPLFLVDMPRAVERILLALARHEHVTVYGDYDADGVTSAALLFRALKKLTQLEGRLDYYIPHRFSQGFGLHTSAIDELHKRGTSLIITTDCGSSDTESVEYANCLGIDTIITDHHRPSEPLPPAYALVNPWRSDETSLHRERSLSGVGVAFKVAQALYRVSGNGSREDEIALLDLVAVGTVADVVPLLGDNHTLVRLGLQRLNETRNSGLQALIACADLLHWRTTLGERDISFGIAPRLNAAGRMQNAALAFRLLTTEDGDEAMRLANELEVLNTERKHATKELLQMAREQALRQNHCSVVLVSGVNWHEGIIGLVAGKLAEELNKPVVVVSQSSDSLLAKGSARSRQGFDLIAALNGYANQLERYGGHTLAAGFTILSDRLPALHEHLLSSWEKEMASCDQNETPEHAIDLKITAAETVNAQFYALICTLAPFGQRFPEPVFRLEGLQVLKIEGMNWRIPRLLFGSVSGSWHATGLLEGGHDLLGAVQVGSYVNILFRLDVSKEVSGGVPRLKILQVSLSSVES